MTDKDNANPVIHATSGLARADAAGAAAAEQWWKDPSVHKVSTGARHGTHLDDDEDRAGENEEEEEKIDSQEIYGEYH